MHWAEEVRGVEEEEVEEMGGLGEEREEGGREEATWLNPPESRRGEGCTTGERGSRELELLDEEVQQSRLELLREEVEEETEGEEVEVTSEEEEEEEKDLSVETDGLRCNTSPILWGAKPPQPLPPPPPSPPAAPPPGSTLSPNAVGGGKEWKAVAVAMAAAAAVQGKGGAG